MRRELDALLSVQRFIAAALPEPWDVRTDLETGEPPERPFALVEFVGPGLTAGGPAAQDRTLPLVANLYLAKADTRAAATDAALDVRETIWQAVRWGSDPARPTTDRIPLYSYEPRIERHRFKVADATGGTFTIDVGEGPTSALPPGVTPTQLAAARRGTGLWDVEYGGALAGVNIGAPTIDRTGLTGDHRVVQARVMLEGAAAPWRTASDYLRVDDFQQTTIRDPADPSLVMVAVDLRLTFGRGLPVPSAQRILQRIGANGGG
jgi:hypothetical protein